MTKNIIKPIIGTATLLLAASAANATPLTVTATSGSLAAEVTFEANPSGKLTVLLKNTSAADALELNQILTGLFFDCDVNLRPQSAVLSGGDVFLGETEVRIFNENVGGEWGYRHGLSGPGGANNGIASTSFGLFSTANFNGWNYGEIGLNGLDFGLTSARDNPGTGHATGNPHENITLNHLIKSWVQFSFSGLPAGFDPSTDIDNVSFQYGESLSDPNIRHTDAAPDGGGTVVLLGLALAGLGTIRRRLDRK